MKLASLIFFSVLNFYRIDAQSIEMMSSNSFRISGTQNFNYTSFLSTEEFDFSNGKNLFFIDFSNLNPPIPINEMIPPEAGFFRTLNYDTKIWGEYLYCDIRQLSLDIRRRNAFRELK